MLSVRIVNEALEELQVSNVIFDGERGIISLVMASSEGIANEENAGKTLLERLKSMGTLCPWKDRPSGDNLNPWQGRSGMPKKLDR